MTDERPVLRSGDMAKPSGETLGDRIARYRKRAGMSQQTLAVAIGVAVTSVSRWERDAAQPSLNTLRAMAKVLGVSAAGLLGD